MISATDYHNRTKHQFNAYAKGPETLDWDDQPNPFRRFDDCPTVALPKPGRQLEVSWSDLTANKISPAPLNMDNLGLMLELAFGLAAWKQYGPDLWSVRCNPSSGNLHPSEAYVVTGLSDLLPKGVYHYVSYDHHLEQRCAFAETSLAEGLWLGLSSVHWREAWKYGERAFRYCQLDAGHALAALSYAAACLGWRVELQHEVTDDQVAELFGINRHDEFIKREGETPDWFCQIHYAEITIDTNISSLIEAAKSGAWQGKAQSLKAYHMYHWKVIDEVLESTVRAKASLFKDDEQAEESAGSEQHTLASKLIRQRRSAQRFQADAEPISAKAFSRMISAVKPGEKPPFTSWDLGTAVHLFLFVHKVEGLRSGLYCLPRSSRVKGKLQAEMNQDFVWQVENGFPGLYLLQAGDTRQVAKSLSCFQAIASDSAFSIGMLCEFENKVAQDAWLYRRLFWECGLVGQVLYLEAEAEGLRGTGIGCFFDDEVHAILGLKTNAFQSMYHFTVGVPVEDERIQTLPAYDHL